MKHQNKTSRVERRKKKSPQFSRRCPSWHIGEAVCGGGETPPAMDVIGRDRWPPTHTHTHTHTHTLLPEAQPQCLVALVVACSSTSLILSLRAAGESYICATFACDVSTEIEVTAPQRLNRPFSSLTSSGKNKLSGTRWALWCLSCWVEHLPVKKPSAAASSHRDGATAGVFDETRGKFHSTVSTKVEFSLIPLIDFRHLTVFIVSLDPRLALNTSYQQTKNTWIQIKTV